MSRGHYLSLEEARNLSQLNQFAKEHPSQADGRFWPLVDAMCKGSLEGAGTSDPVASEGYSGTRTHLDTSEDDGG